MSSYVVLLYVLVSHEYDLILALILVSTRTAGVYAHSCSQSVFRCLTAMEGHGRFTLWIIDCLSGLPKAPASTIRIF